MPAPTYQPREVTSTCSYCGVGCSIRVRRAADGQLSVKGDESSPVNRGMLCSKGRYLHHVVQDHSERLLYPELRPARGEALVRTSWDGAIGHVAGELQRIIAAHGPEAVGLYVSGQMLTEEYYLANKLMKGFIGCNNIDTNSRLCMSSAVMGYKLALGDDLVPGSYADFEACSCFLITGANPAWCHPILFRRLEAHKQAHPEVKVIVVDPRRTDSCELADLHLQLHPGTDVTLCNAIAKVLVDEGLIDREFVEAHTEGFGELQATLGSVDLDAAAAVCGVPRADIEQAARWVGESGSFMSLWAMGLNQSAAGTDKNLALLNLSLLTGAIGKPGSGPFSLTGQPNAMGGREVGGMATLLAAHLDLKNAEHRERVATFWGGKAIKGEPGLTATEMVDALEAGRLKAIWIVCTNPAVSLPNIRRLERALGNAELVIVQDISRRSDSLAFADVVLPAAGWLEKAGTMTNSERRVSYLPALTAAPGEALPDVEIFCRVATAMGWGDRFAYGGAAEVFDEWARLTKGTPVDMAGLSHARLEREGAIQWPCPATDHPGTPRLFADGVFPRPGGRARLFGVAPLPPEQPPTADYPLVLTTGRIRDQWHTMTRTGTVTRLNQHLDLPFVEVHPADAAALGIGDGTCARLVSSTGEMTVHAKVTEAIKRGVAFVPMHWGKRLGGGRGRANAATSDRIDPVSKQPDFKYMAVRLEAVATPARRIVIVGAGAAALAFAEALRERGRRDPVTVIGDEALPFYNRVLLPDLVSRHRRWDDLVTADADRAAELGVTHLRGDRVVAIDREARTVTTASGRAVPYDVLVLATGSRPTLPRQLLAAAGGAAGVVTLRRREDAEHILAQVRPGLPVIVAGGGLLGLELAAALNEAGCEVLLLQRSETLMRKQLDALAAEMLCEHLQEQGILIRFETEIGEVLTTDGRISGVRTTGGEIIATALVCVAAGVTPNAELGRAAGLATNRGVLVNETLATDDPHIFAMGEVAEFESQCYGTTPAASDQARVLAAHLAGDIWAVYRGSTDANILKVPGLDLCSMGIAEPPPGASDAYEEVVLLDRRRRYYKKCLILRDRLVGAILMGDKTEFSSYLDLVATGKELEDLRDTLLRPGAGNSEPQIGALVCSCHGVGEGNLQQHIEAGCNDFQALCRLSKAGTGCGSCRPEVRRLLAQRLDLASPAAP